jgi:hypothetical protein
LSILAHVAHVFIFFLLFPIIIPPSTMTHTEGNVMFRQLVAAQVNEYQMLQSKGDRPGTLRLVRAVIAQVDANGGRFLDKNWKNEVGNIHRMVIVVVCIGILV